MFFHFSDSEEVLRASHYNKNITRSKQKGPHLFLDPIELYHFDDEGSRAALVLNGPQQGPYVVHTEGLWPAPVPPSLDADVQQLQDTHMQDRQKQNTADIRG